MKARIQIAILIFATVCCFALITSCSQIFVSDDNNPTVAWEEFCGYISDGDYRAAIEMTGNSIEVSGSDLDDSVEGLMLTKLAESIDTHVVVEPRINGIGAWQSVSITHLDVSLLMKKALDGVMKETEDYEWNHGSYKSDAKIDEAVKTALNHQLSGDLADCMVTDIIKVEFRYKDGRWIPVMTKALYNAITGNAADASGSVDEFFEEYKAQKSAEKKDSTKSAESAQSTESTESTESAESTESKQNG